MAAEEVAREALADALGPIIFQTLERYVDILANRGIDWGLLGPREGTRLWQRHVGNSLALRDVLGQGLMIADIGSGAGLPGLALAIARPDLRVSLIEPMLRRSSFLSLAVEELGLSEQVEVVRARAEDVKASYDAVVCRAVAPLERLLGWSAPLFPDGELIALKGSSAEAEVLAAAKVLTRYRMRAEILELAGDSGVEPTRAIRVFRL